VNLIFNGEVEHGTAPTQQSASDILNSVNTRRSYLEGSRSGRHGRPDGPHDPYKRLGVRRRSALFDLLYWQVRNFHPMLNSLFMQD
jgi:hypothetical protein